MIDKNAEIAYDYSGVIAADDAQAEKLGIPVIARQTGLQKDELSGLAPALTAARNDLLDDLHASLADGSYAKRLRAWARPALLIIDDVGLGQLKKRDDEPTAAHTLYNLVDRRHGRASTAITSNIKLSEWGRYLGDATITAAILDRLVMNAIRFDIDGPSYRQHVAEERAAKATKKKRK